MKIAIAAVYGGTRPPSLFKVFTHELIYTLINQDIQDLLAHKYITVLTSPRNVSPADNVIGALQVAIIDEARFISHGVESMVQQCYSTRTIVC